MMERWSTKDDAILLNVNSNAFVFRYDNRCRLGIQPIFDGCAVNAFQESDDSNELSELDMFGKGFMTNFLGIRILFRSLATITMDDK